MVRNLGELTKFLVFNSVTESFGSSSVFAFSLLLFALYSFLYFLVGNGFLLRISDVFVVVFQMNMANYTHFYLTKDVRLCSMGQHCPGFPRMLYDALLSLGYKGDALIYRCRLSMSHAMEVCEASMMIPINSSEPWSGSFIASEPNTAVEMMAHATLTYLSESRLTTIAALPTALLSI
jgi:hypothetical protein